MTKARDNADNWAADITGVTAGTGITGGGTSGTVTVTNSLLTTIDAAGDLLYGTGSDAASRLAIGTAGQVLQVNSGATAPEWATAAGGGMEGLTLLNSGNTTVGTGATKTWSGLSSYQNYIVYVDNVSRDSSNCNFYIEAGGGATAISWTWAGLSVTNAGSYSASNFKIGSGGGTDMNIGFTPIDVDNIKGFIRFYNANKTGLKYATVNCGNASNNGGTVRVTTGYESGASGIALDYIKIGGNVGSFDAGNVYIWGA